MFKKKVFYPHLFDLVDFIFIEGWQSPSTIDCILVGLRELEPTLPDSRWFKISDFWQH